MFGVDPALERLSQDGIGQTASMPRLSERQESVGSTNSLEIVGSAGDDRGSRAGPGYSLRH